MWPVVSVMSAVPMLFPLFVIDISAKSVTGVLFPVYYLSSHSLLYWSLQSEDARTATASRLRLPPHHRLIQIMIG